MTANNTRGSSMVRTAFFCAATSLLVASSLRAEPTTRPSDAADPFAEKMGEWSPRQVEQTPNGKRSFLGSFTVEPVTFTLKHLPPHDYVRVKFDLLILLTWDGSGHEENDGPWSVGPDFLNIAVDGGPLLMMHTFSNIPADPGFRRTTFFQSYPSPVAGDLVPAQTGAAERQTLGYKYVPGPLFKMDTVYEITLLIPHHGDTLRLNFNAPNLQKTVQVTDEAWGIDAVNVEPVARESLHAPDAATSKQLLEDACDTRDPSAANEAFQALLEGGDETRKVLHAAREEAGIDWKKVDKLVAQLASADEASRATAFNELVAMGGVAEIPLRRVVADSKSPTQRDSAVDVLDRILTTPITEAPRRRAAVANRLLEVIDHQ